MAFCLSKARTLRAWSSGLGLALVQVVADKHGGQVEVTDSALGGAGIRLHLPLETGGVVEAEAAC